MNEDEKKFLKNEIFKNCKTILKTYVKHKRFFFHGRPRQEDFLILNRIENRKPKDISMNYHNLINKALINAGFRANRSNSLFCTSAFEFAKNYAALGNVYVVFPYDGFSYLWSPHLEDFAEHVDDIIESVTKEIHRETTEKSFFIKNSKKFGYNIDGHYFVPEKHEKFFLMDIEDMFNITAYDILELFHDHPDLFDFSNINSKKKAEFMKKMVENYCYKISNTEKYYESMFMEKLENSIKNLYTNYNLEKALYFPVEVMINADKFILINSEIISDYENLKKFFQG